MTCEPRRVLIIHGDPPSARSLELILATEAYAVRTVSRGDEGVSLAAGEDFQVVILAPELPDMSGLDAIRRLRQAGVGAPMFLARRETAGVGPDFGRQIRLDAVD